jgi:hypothetical protein
MYFSWENGTKAQAILEWKYPSISIFSISAPPPLPLPQPLPTGDIPELIDVAQVTLQNRPASNTSASALGGSSLLEDGSAADPASLGVAIIVANASDSSAQIKGVTYRQAAESEVNYLLYDVPRVSGLMLWLGVKELTDSIDSVRCHLPPV